jgi:hypothetical protein
MDGPTCSPLTLEREHLKDWKGVLFGIHRNTKRCYSRYITGYDVRRPTMRITNVTMVSKATIGSDVIVVKCGPRSLMEQSELTIYLVQIVVTMNSVHIVATLYSNNDLCSFCCDSDPKMASGYADCLVPRKIAIDIHMDGSTVLFAHART